MDSVTKLGAATLVLVGERPYLGAAMWAVTRVPCPDVPTMAVDDGWRLYYNPEAVDAWSVTEIAGVFYHELCHLLREHAERAAGIGDPVGWNLAADAEINDDLRAEQVRLPHGAVFPSTLGQPDGLLAEEYYGRLKRTDRRTRAGVPGPTAGKCGSAATARPDVWELAVTDAAARPALSEGEKLVIRHRVALEIREHANGRGTVPGHWQRWATARLEPRVDWRRELASLVRQAVADASGAVDYRYERPSRRQSCFGRIVVPSLRRPEPRIAVVVDTSGSMGGELLSAAMSELDGVFRSISGREAVTVLAVDAAVHACQRAFRPEHVRLAGGGGTDMGVGLAAVALLRPRPSVAIVLTDGYTPWPILPLRGITTVVVLLNPGGHAPPWARAIVVDAVPDKSAA